MKTKIIGGKKFLIILLLGICIITLAMTFISQNDEKAFAIEQYEDKVYCNTTINEDFADDCVLVVVDKFHSKLNKKYNKEYFKGLQIKSVTDLMAIDKSEDELTFLNTEDFRQILKLELEEPFKQNVLDVVHTLEQMDGVLSASPSHAFKDYSLPACSEGSRYADLWGLHGEYGIDAESAWEITTGSSSVRVGIIDTGVDSHDDLTGNLVEGWNVLSEDTTQNDTVGHGTHIAGTIGATGDNEVGVVGVAPNVSLVPIQAAIGLPIPLLDMVIPLLNEDTCVSAIEWAIENNIDIINFSIGSYSEPLALKTAISDYTGLFVCAAGNGQKVSNEYIGLDTNSTPCYPANYTHGQTFSNRIISVGAIDSAGDITSFSNYGATTVDVFAPGANILSTVPTSVSSNGYAYFNGTSMATPHVVGVAALLWSEFLWNPYELSRADIAVKVKQTILQNVTYDSRYIGKCLSGGRLNAYKALNNIPYRQVMSGFGYSSLLHHWRGEEDLLIDKTYSFSVDSSKTLVFDESTDLTFSLATNSVYNAWYEITGSFIYTLKNSADEIIPIEGNDSFTSTFRVGLISNVSYTNESFTINTGTLTNDTYTLYLSCTASRIGDTESSSEAFTFRVNSSCVAEGSLITLIDGTQVAVENLTGNENILVWDMHTGEYGSAPILFIDSDPSTFYEVIKLTFSDGTEVKVIDEHAFFDMTLGEYIFLRKNASQYIGDYFNKQGTNGAWTTVQLMNVNVYTETTTAWSPVTYGYLCYYVNGMLSMPGATEGLINIFDVNTALMKYDDIQKATDIQTYGLYTYEEFNAIIPVPEFVFNAFGGQYLKVSIGKGLITLPEIAALLERYADFFD
jgi:subtilisin family serine protease